MTKRKLFTWILITLVIVILLAFIRFFSTKQIGSQYTFCSGNKTTTQIAGNGSTENIALTGFRTKLYSLQIPSYSEIMAIDNRYDFLNSFSIDSGFLSFNLNITEFPLSESREIIFSLVPQNTSRPQETSIVKIGNLSIAKAKYQAMDLKQFYEKSEAKAQKWPAYGYIIKLKDRQVFLFTSGVEYDDIWFETNILKTFKAQ